MTAAGTFALDVNTYLTTSSASSTYVPYSGATGSVTLGSNSFTAGTIYSSISSGNNINIDKSGGGTINFTRSAVQHFLIEDDTNGIGFYYGSTPILGTTIGQNINTSGSVTGGAATFSNNIGWGGQTPNGNSGVSYTLESVNGVQLAARQLVPQLYVSSNVVGTPYSATRAVAGYATQLSLDSYGGTISLNRSVAGAAGSAITWFSILAFDNTGAATFSSSVTASSFSASANITGGTGLSGALTGTLNNISIGSTQYTPLGGSNDDRYMKVTLYDGGLNGTRGGFSYGYDAQGNFGGLTLLAQRSFSFQSGSNGSVFIVNGSYNTVFTQLPIWSNITTSGIPFANINDAYNASAPPGGQIFNSAIHEYALGYGSTPNVNGTAVLKWNTSGNVTVAGTFGMKGYTVGTLPAGVTGAWAYVTDASGPTYGATVVGGGSVVTPVFYNGSNWTCR
jgi:hypothetical protein